FKEQSAAGPNPLNGLVLQPRAIPPSTPGRPKQPQEDPRFPAVHCTAPRGMTMPCHRSVGIEPTLVKLALFVCIVSLPPATAAAGQLLPNEAAFAGVAGWFEPAAAVEHASPAGPSGTSTALKEQTAEINKLIATDYDHLEALYKHIHTHPELSQQEEQT